MSQSYYDTLGVSRDADADAIKSAFRGKARKLHPDVSDDPDAGRKFSELNEAYEVLSDPEKKAKYDQLGHERFVSGMSGQHVRAQDVDFGDLGSIIDAMFGGGMGGGFSGFGGQRTATRGGPRAATMKGRDMQLGLRVSLKDIHVGATKTMHVPKGDRYPSIDVHLPKGVKDGGKLRLKGQGFESPVSGGQAGDLYVTVQIDHTGLHQRIDDSLDLTMDLPLSIAEATLGAKVDVRTIDDRVVELKIPEGTVSESRFRIRGHGLNGTNGSRGDLFVKVKIIPPSGVDITDALRDALADIPKLDRV